MPITDADITRGAEILCRGGLVAFPTETVYGLGANALDCNAIRRVYEAKGRPSTSPLIVHVDSIEMAREVAVEWPAAAQRLAVRYWPGPLTLVVRKSDKIPPEVTAGLDTVGIRVPDHTIALELIHRAGVPLAAPSANRFTQLSPTTAEHVRAGLGDCVDMILDGGPCRVGVESTVISVVDDVPVMLRPGIITAAEIQDVIGPVEERTFVMNGSEAHASPGQHSKHYAPRTPLYVLRRGEKFPFGRGLVLNMPPDPAAFAACLYSKLHAADTDEWEWLVIMRPPEGPEWTAVLDRLQRASANGC